MELCIDAENLRKALSEIEAAEANGFMYCQAILRIVSAGPMLSDCRVEYSDLSEKAHPTNGNLDWGRFQSVSKRNRFIDGKLVPIKPELS